jgi:hemerythrin-like domain-containing protein
VTIVTVNIRGNIYNKIVKVKGEEMIKMEKYLNMSINSVITEFPEVGKLLDDYGIGCVTCNIGTCLLNDVLKIHYLPKDEEIEVMQGIKEIITSGGKAPTSIKRKKESVAISYAPPIKKLVEEHDRIKRLLSMVPFICDSMEKSSEINRKLIDKAVFYIRNYADQFHHAKEEDILFKYTDEEQEIIKVMYQEHDYGRNYIREALEGVEEGNISKITSNLRNYMELLFNHIKKEDEILYPWIEKAMTKGQLEELERLFSETDKKFDEDFELEFEGFLVSLELKFKKK